MSELEGKTVAFAGRLLGLSRARAAAAVAARGGRVRRGLTRGTDALVVGAAAYDWLDDGRLERLLARADKLGIASRSEAWFLRAAGLLPPAPPTGRLGTGQELAARAHLDPRTLRILELFGVVEPGDGAAGFQDLVSVREVARLLDEGLSLGAILRGAAELRRSGAPAAHPLARVKLLRAADGGLARRIEGGLAELDGQLRLPLGDAGNPSADDLFEAAERAEEEGDWPAAAALYRRCLALDKADPVVPYNLANVLVRQGHNAEAEEQLRAATARDPGFAEAWYNLGHLLEARGRNAAARECFTRSSAADGGFADPLYNLARSCFEDRLYEAAAQAWERYLALDPNSAWGRKARQGLALCRRLLAHEAVR